jgi:hypothetical protein
LRQVALERGSRPQDFPWRINKALPERGRIGIVPYGRYLRFVWPLLVMLAVLTVVVLGVAALAS